MHIRPKPPSVPASPRAFSLLPFALLFGALLAGAPALAGPEGGTVVSGNADIVRTSPTRLDIVQGSDKAVIDWRSFSIGAGEHTDFRQPSSSSIALNRVRGGGQSFILGRLTANGRIFLINPNGILFGASARVDVGGLLATTIDIGDDDFLAGRFDFDIPGNPGGTVVNRGGITAAEGGLAALVAPGVENSGTIRARLGRVALASGNAFTLDLHGDNLIRIGIDDRVAERLTAADGVELEALVSNSGAIEADGGTVVLLAAGVGRDVVDYAINMDGIVRARTAEKRGGRIVLRGAGDGVVRVAGALDASGRGRGETGGAVRVLGEKVGIVGEARIDASGDAGGGEILVGGNFQGKGPERNADYTAVGSGAFIRADALSRGDGGRVIVWSNRVTRFFGGISARGGSASGDGGFAEVSGKLRLQFAPVSIDLGAPNGALGELLLDPQDIIIDTSSTNDDSEVSDNEILFGDEGSTPPTDYTIQPSAFQAVDADITLQATRDITVSSAIAMTGQSATRTLTLQAGRHLTINADITGHSTRTLTSNNGAIAFSGAVSGARALTVAAGTGAVTFSGSIWLRGTNNALRVTGPTMLNANVSASGLIDFNSAVTLGGSGATRAVTGGRGSGHPVSFDAAVNGARSLTVNAGAGAVTFSGAVSLTGTDNALRVTGPTTLHANVLASGLIDFNSAVTLAGDVEVTGGGDSAHTVSFDGGVTGPHALTVNAGTGAVTFSGAVTLTGSGSGLSVTTSGATMLNADVTTTGAISVTGAATLRANVTTTNSAITFGGKVTLGGSNALTVSSGSGGGDIVFSGTVFGGRALTIEAGTGAVTFGGAVTLTGGSGLSVTTSGATMLNADVIASGGNIDFHSAVTLADTASDAVTVASGSGGGNIRFHSTVDGTGNGVQALTVNAGTGSVTFSAAVGGTTALTSLDVTGGGGIGLAANVTTANGGITFTGAVTLTGSGVLTVSSANGGVLFSSTVSGARALTVAAGTGAVTFSTTVGTLTRLMVTGSGRVTLTGNVIVSATTGTAVSFAGPARRCG